MLNKAQKDDVIDFWHISITYNKDRYSRLLLVKKWILEKYADIENKKELWLDINDVIN